MHPSALQDNPGLHEHVHKAIMACSIDQRRELSRLVVCRHARMPVNRPATNPLTRKSPLPLLSKPSNIYLSGGTSMIPGVHVHPPPRVCAGYFTLRLKPPHTDPPCPSGLGERLTMELKRMLPSSCPVTVHAGPKRLHAAYCGSSVLSLLSTFTEVCVWAADWHECGPAAIAKWSHVKPHNIPTE